MKKPTRAPRHQVNKRQKALAIKALSEIVESNAQPCQGEGRRGAVE